MHESPDQKGLLPEWKPDGESAAHRAPVKEPKPVPPEDHSHTSQKTEMAKTPHAPSSTISSAMLGGVGMKR